MPKILCQVTYSAEGARSLIEGGGTKREETLSDVARSLGGSMELCYFSPQQNMAVTIFDLPQGFDTEKFAGFILAVNGAGFARVDQVARLITAKELDSVAEKARATKVPGK